MSSLFSDDSLHFMQLIERSGLFDSRTVLKSFCFTYPKFKVLCISIQLQMQRFKGILLPDSLFSFHFSEIQHFLISYVHTCRDAGMSDFECMLFVGRPQSHSDKPSSRRLKTA